MLELIDLAIINITGSRAIKANADDRWRRTIVDAEVRWYCRPLDDVNSN